MQTARPRLATYLLPPAVLFGLAFVVDMATGQRFSAAWGSMAIVGSIVAVFRSLRPALLAIGAYGGTWIGFNLLRAGADDLGLRLVSADAISRIEAALAGGRSPSAVLQQVSSESGLARTLDPAFTLVYASFFVSPFVLGAVIWLRRRGAFWRYVRATAITFVVGVVAFALLPTAPPWMTDEDEVRRVPHQLLYGDGEGGGAGFWFDPNPLAAFPSIHVAAVALVGLALGLFGRRWARMGLVYTGLMAIAVVYLGEHHVADAVAALPLAWLAWRVAHRGARLPHSPPGPERA